MQPPIITHNHPQPPTTIHNYLQLSTTTQKTTHNHPQLPTSIRNNPQPPKSYSKSQDLPQTVMLLHFRCSYWNRRWVLIVIPNNGIHTCLCVCMNILYKSLHWLFFGLAGCLFLSVLKVIHLMLKAMIFVS